VGVVTRLCLDTSVLIAFLKGREPGASAAVQSVQHLNCLVTAITVYELLFGVARSQKQIGEEALVRVMTVLSFDDRTARRAAKLHVELIRRNDEIGIKDLLIAAICLEHSLPILTLNERHFSRVPQLQVISPQALLSRMT
jgi:tRNA(fMet)-specific endonuclease VapC